MMKNKHQAREKRRICHRTDDNTEKNDDVRTMERMTIETKVMSQEV